MTTTSNSRQGLILGLTLAIASAVLWLWGTYAHEGNAVRDMTQRQHLVALKVQAELLPVQFTVEPHKIAIYARGKSGYSHFDHYEWDLLDTEKWTFLNARWGASYCPALLKSFMEFNVPEQHLLLDDLTKMVVDSKNTPTTFLAFVPRFKASPPALAQCKDERLGYDADKGLLTLNGKPVAVLADTRLPGWKL